jgi:hypothetical protein
VALSADGKLLASAGGQSVHIWDAATGNRVHRLLNCLATRVAFAPDGRMLATAGRNLDDAVRLWDVATGKELRRLGVGASYVGLGFLSDGESLFAADHNGRIWVWETASGKLRRQLQVQARVSVWAAALSPDDRLLLSGDGGGDVRLWELSTGRQVHFFPGHAHEVLSVAFAPGGRAAASASGDTTALVWDLTGRASMARPAKLSEKELDAAWTDLGDEDTDRAYQALWGLVDADGQALALLKKQLNLVAEARPERLARLISDLDANRFVVRERATAELRKLSGLAVPALRHALAQNPPLEMRRRLEALLERLSSTETERQRLRWLRSATVLEHIGNNEAQQLLRTLATGAPDPELAADARASLRRLAH